MKQLPKLGVCLLILLMYCSGVHAQEKTMVTGYVKNADNKEAIAGASITIKESAEGTITDNKGYFSLSTTQKLPYTLQISFVGFTTQEISITLNNQAVNISLVLDASFGHEVVVGSTRTAVRLLESPVSVERMSTATIRNASAPNYYDGVANLKGVDLTTSSLTFRTVSTRGFNGSGNLRFNQLIDGMDNQAPGLSFSVGNIIGLTELDVDNVELLPGASSALYGSGGMNGTMLMTSKSPFKSQGLSVQYKQGFNHFSDYRHPVAPMFDGEIRFAKAFRDKFAFKIAAKYFAAQDWQADDTSNLLRNTITSNTKPGTRGSDINYDGVNVFGDEASASMQALAQAVRAQFISGGGTPAANGIDQMLAGGATPQMIAAYFNANSPGVVPFLPFLIPTSTARVNGNPQPYAGIFGNRLVSRTGYYERDIVDYNAYNFKLTGGLFYKIGKNTEASLQAYFGRGTTVYTGSDRYALKNLQVGQYRAEIKSTNWFLRGYTTQENSGDSYTATTAAVAVNAAWKANTQWFQEYTSVYATASLGLSPYGTPQSETQANAAARAVAENGRYLPGSQAFKDAFNKAVNTPISQGGAKFNDKTNLYHAEGQYNLTNAVKVMEVLAGASFRVYHLNSGGTIFADTIKPINISEYGTYIQLQKKLFNEILKLTASGRYDKNENFKGRFTPRFSALVKVAKDNNIRLSYQVAYRFPSTQDQYINLQTPAAKLIGGLPEFNTYYNFNNSPAYTAESVVAYRNSFATTPNPSLLQVAPFTTIKPETVNAYEIGYRGLVTKRLLLDVYGYMNRYKNFIGRIAVGRGASAVPANRNLELASPFTTTAYSFAVNSIYTVKALGWGLGAEYRLIKGYSLQANVSGDQLNDVPNNFVTFFNAPKVRYNIGFANPDVYHHFGFNAMYRWQDKVNWEGTFGSGQIPSYGTLDAHISYTIPKYKSLIKFGGTNLLNKYYRSAFGNPYVGGLYYMSVGYNVF